MGNPYAVFAFINFVTCLGLGFLVLIRNPHHKLNLIFSFFSIDVSLWSLCYYIWQISSNPVQALFWSKALMAFAIFIPALYLNLVLIFLGLEEKKKILLWASYLLFGIFLLTDVFTSNFIVNVEPVLRFPYWPRAGLIFSVFLAFWGGYVVYDTYLLYTYQKNATGLSKQQIKYVFWGLVVGFSGGITNYFLWYRILIPPFGNILVSLYVALTAYAIVKHRFLDIRFVLARTVAYILLLVIFAAFYSLSIFWISNSFLGNSIGSNQPIVYLLLALFIAFTFQPLKNILEKITENVFFKANYSSNQLLSRLSKTAASTLNLEYLTKQSLHDLLSIMHISHGTFLIYDNGNIYPPIYEGIRNPPHYDLELIKQLSGIKKLVIFEEESDESIKDLMRQYDFYISLPLYVGDKQHGLLVLGEKKSGGIYTTQDIEVLGIFGPEISVAVQNAKAYEEIRRFNITLKQEVDRATKQLRDLTEQQKDQVDIMGHEVKTPLTAISQQLNLLLDMILTEDKRKEWLKGNIQLEDAKRVVEGLIKMRVAEVQEESIVTNMVEAARLDKLRFELNYSTFDLIELVQGAIKESEERLETDKQEGKISLQTGLKKLEVEADKTRIKQCIDGLLTNAEKYGRNPTTHTLDVIVKISTENSNVSISINDKGMGIKQNDMDKLGKKFSRLDPHTNGSKLPRPGGSGLGLYTYKGIIEHHQGHMIIQSDGIGRGSKFTLKFPLRKPQS